MSPLCEICQCDEVVAERKLCAVCGEADSVSGERHHSSSVASQ